MLKCFKHKHLNYENSYPFIFLSIISFTRITELVTRLKDLGVLFSIRRIDIILTINLKITLYKVEDFISVNKPNFLVWNESFYISHAILQRRGI